ncbi:LysR family transcriptional regulator [Ramlibacter sp.]|uniref:LysR family transcriptional regulator n=1 Tax=Ramlibacter sp. TaxID=1917967 RepID=UPI002FCC21F9|nr:transcriptional regulator, LysR family [Ramlibacter sp.]
MAKAPISDAALLLRLRTRQLLLLEALGRENNLGRAAAGLGMSQPAATKLLQQVEETMGARLFTRLARGMEPTPAGEVLVRYARQALVDFGFAREQVAALRSGLRGRLRLGTVPGALPQLLAPALAEFKRLHPRVAVSVLVETSDVMIALLERGEVDLVLGRPTERHSDEELDIEPLLAEPQVAVVRTGHPLLSQGGITLEDLVRWPWVLQPPGSPQRSRFESALREAGLHSRLDITETASTVATTVLLEASDMAAIMPASLAAHYARLGVLRVVPLELPLRVPSIHLITRRHRELSPAAQGFAHALRAAG